MEIDRVATEKQTDFSENEVLEQLSALSLCGGEEKQNSPQPEKDPRRIARK